MSDLPTPATVLDYWIGPAANDADAAAQKNKLWFIKSDATDQQIAALFGPLVTALAGDLALEWAAQGPRQRLAAIIALDQFPRNMFRGNAQSFAYDPLALDLTMAGLANGDDKSLSEVERVFFYLPLEHSEQIADQDRAIQQYSGLAQDARPSFKPLCENTLAYAHKHRDVIVEYARFPHRNAMLGRTNTPEEQAYLARPGSGF